MVSINQNSWLMILDLFWCLHREAGRPRGPQSCCSCGQLSPGLWDERVHKGTSCIHTQRLQVNTHAHKRTPHLPSSRHPQNILLSPSCSAILYLNDDFEGGNFFFTELDAKTVTVNFLHINKNAIKSCCFFAMKCCMSYILALLQAEVRPQCGRVVGFGAGKENPHGVRAVTKGQRCAVALWFTLDPNHQEKVSLVAP